MARRRGFFAELEHGRAEQRKQAARLQRENERLTAQAKRERERLARDAEKADKQAARAAAAAHLQAQQAEVAALNDQLTTRVSELDSILVNSLRRSARVPFATLRRTPAVRRFEPDPVLATPHPLPSWNEFAPGRSGVVQRMLFKQQAERATVEAQGRFDAAKAQYEAGERERLRLLREAQQAHEAQAARARREADELNAKVDAFERAFTEGRPEAVNDYFELALESRMLPSGVPSEVEVAYQPESRRLLVVMDLPDVALIPEQTEYRYVRTKNEITPKPRPVREINKRYSDLVAQLVLCTMRDIFEIGSPELIAEVGISAHVSTRNRATGRPEHPCLVSLMTPRAQFGELVLTDLDPTECLRRHLSAVVSQHPHDLEAVRPVFDPDLSKYKFVDAHDAVTDLDSRVVLLDMHPTEFELLVRQLFEAMGLKSWVTQPSRDDGVDAVAVNEDPVMGGVCIIQAKRYRGVVPTEAVRALAGVMQQMKAGRGVLVTTSWFGRQSHDFAADNGRIQLIEGSHLKHMLVEHLGMNVVIGELKGRRGSS